MLELAVRGDVFVVVALDINPINDPRNFYIDGSQRETMTIHVHRARERAKHIVVVELS